MVTSSKDSRNLHVFYGMLGNRSTCFLTGRRTWRGSNVDQLSSILIRRLVRPLISPRGAAYAWQSAANLRHATAGVWVTEGQAHARLLFLQSQKGAHAFAPIIFIRNSRDDATLRKSTSSGSEARSCAWSKIKLCLCVCVWLVQCRSSV